MDKISISQEKILAAARGSERWMKKNTGTRHKPRSFAERDAISKTWHRKFTQRDFFKGLSNAILKDNTFKNKLIKLVIRKF